MSHIYESSNSIGYSRLLAWSRSFFASPSASRSLWIPSLCDAILELFFLFWWKNDVRLFFIYRAEFRGSNQYFVVGWAQGLMTSRFDWWRHANFLGWNPWEWICVKRESFFWLKFRSKEKFFSVFMIWPIRIVFRRNTWPIRDGVDRWGHEPLRHHLLFLPVDNANLAS